VVRAALTLFFSEKEREDLRGEKRKAADRDGGGVDWEEEGATAQGEEEGGGGNVDRGWRRDRGWAG
jgi:hypothetical protein